MSSSMPDRFIPCTSEVKIQANRQNAKKSTGPKTSQGKRNASRNALKHGIFSSVVVSDPEEQRLYDNLVTELCNEYAPVGAREQMALEKAIVCLWRYRRAVRYETQQTQSREKAGLGQQFGRTIHYEAHLQRAYKDAIEELERLQAARKAKEGKDTSDSTSSPNATNLV